MGARASRRRHEGRRIRKFRRKYGIVTPAFARVTRGMLPLGHAAKRAASSIGMLVEVWDTPSGSIATAQRPDGTVLVGIDPGAGHPSHSGVEALRSTQEAAEKVDAAAAHLGLELMPWQRAVAVGAITGQELVLEGGRRAGKATVKRVVDEIRGPSYDIAWVDEVQ
ncbi:hypothetical protein SEA_FIZZLES_47 [Microbacterium phage Fizzles]|nr:hypothetical protein SEA_FIZZLES_47 [Microbacterium phage Fizzles]